MPTVDRQLVDQLLANPQPLPETVQQWAADHADDDQAARLAARDDTTGDVHRRLLDRDAAAVRAAVIAAGRITPDELHDIVQGETRKTVLREAAAVQPLPAEVARLLADVDDDPELTATLLDNPTVAGTDQMVGSLTVRLTRQIVSLPDGTLEHRARRLLLCLYDHDQQAAVEAALARGDQPLLNRLRTRGLAHLDDRHHDRLVELLDGGRLRIDPLLAWIVDTIETFTPQLRAAVLEAAPDGRAAEARRAVAHRSSAFQRLAEQACSRDPDLLRTVASETLAASQRMARSQPLARVADRLLANPALQASPATLNDLSRLSADGPGAAVWQLAADDHPDADRAATAVLQATLKHLTPPDGHDLDDPASRRVADLLTPLLRHAELRDATMALWKFWYGMVGLGHMPAQLLLTRRGQGYTLYTGVVIPAVAYLTGRVEESPGLLDTVVALLDGGFDGSIDELVDAAAVLDGNDPDGDG